MNKKESFTDKITYMEVTPTSGVFHSVVFDRKIQAFRDECVRITIEVLK